MADNQRVRPMRQGGHLGAEQRSTVDHALRALFHRGPPDLVDMGEIQPRPIAGQLGYRGADVAAERIALAHDGVDQRRETQRPRNRGRGLQGAGVGRDDDVLDPLLLQRLSRFFGLGVAQRGQARVNNARITARGCEVQIEFALAVAQEDHARVIAAPPPRRNPGRCAGGGRYRVRL